MAIPVVQRGGVRWIRAGPERVMDKQGQEGQGLAQLLSNCDRRYGWLGNVAVLGRPKAESYNTTLSSKSDKVLLCYVIVAGCTLMQLVCKSSAPGLTCIDTVCIDMCSRKDHQTVTVEQPTSTGHLRFTEKC